MPLSNEHYKSFFNLALKAYEGSTNSVMWPEWENVLSAFFKRDSLCMDTWLEVRTMYSKDFIAAVEHTVDNRLAKEFNRSVWKEAHIEEERNAEDQLEGIRINNFQVMQSWELPLMQAMASIVEKGDRVLEIGYGMGICSREIQRSEPAKHIIFEANTILADLAKLNFKVGIEDGTIEILNNFWEDVFFLDNNTGFDNYFDSIIFDTFPLERDELSRNHFKFFQYANKLLKKGGKFTYYSDEISTLSVGHQMKLWQTFEQPSITIKQIQVKPFETTEYWKDGTILHIVVTK
jgi:hypothetical protein